MTGHASPVRSAVTRAGRAGRSASGLALPRCGKPSPTAASCPKPARTQPPIAALRHYARTSPGRLVAIMIVLSLALLLTGWYSASVLDDRTSTLRAMVDRTEPLAESAQVLYSSCRSPTRRPTGRSCPAAWSRPRCAPATPTPSPRPRPR